MPPRRVIGIDAGGTKLLGGVVDEELVVHHRVHRLWRGADRQETLDIFLEAVEEVRAAAPDVEAVGFGIPALVEWETGVSRWSNHLPLEDVRFRDLMSERLGLPVVVDNDAQRVAARRGRAGAARGARHVVMVSLGTGIGSGLLSRRARSTAARAGCGAELGHIGARPRTGPTARAHARAAAASRRSRPAPRSGARASGSRRERPDSALGRRLRGRAARSPAGS